MVKSALCIALILSGIACAQASEYRVQISASATIKADALKIDVIENTPISPVAMNQLAHQIGHTEKQQGIESLLVTNEATNQLPGNFVYSIQQQKIEMTALPIVASDFLTVLSTDHTGYKIYSIKPYIPQKVKSEIEKSLTTKLTMQAEIYANMIAATKNEKTVVEPFLISFEIAPASKSPDMDLVDFGAKAAVPIDQTITASATVVIVGQQLNNNA